MGHQRGCPLGQAAIKRPGESAFGTTSEEGRTVLRPLLSAQ